MSVPGTHSGTAGASRGSDVEAAVTPHALTAPPGARVLLMLEGRENLRLLEEALSSRAEVVAADAVPPGRPFDLGIVDVPALERHLDAICSRRESERPVALPFILVTPRPDRLPPRLAAAVDEVIRVPVAKAELGKRVGVLLFLRALSIELSRQARDLGARLGRVIENSSDEIYVFDAETLGLVQVNRGAARGLGYSSGELLHLSFADLGDELHADEIRALLLPLERREREDIQYETLHRRRDGSAYPVEVRVTLSHAEARPVFVAMARDITGRKRSEAAVATAHARALRIERQREEAARALGAAYRRALRVEQERLQFVRDVLRAVTEDKLLLVDRGDMPPGGVRTHDAGVRDGAEYATARVAIQSAARAAGMDPERAGDLVLAAGEAMTNALKHAGGGRCEVFRSSAAVTVRITDTGPGIRWEHLPATIFTPGFSTATSLGLGYTLILRLADRLWLSTGPDGTALQIEKLIEAPREEFPLLRRLSLFTGSLIVP